MVAITRDWYRIKNESILRVPNRGQNNGVHLYITTRTVYHSNWCDLIPIPFPVLTIQYNTWPVLWTSPKYQYASKYISSYQTLVIFRSAWQFLPIFVHPVHFQNGGCNPCACKDFPKCNWFWVKCTVNTIWFCDFYAHFNSVELFKVS